MRLGIIALLPLADAFSPPADIRVRLSRRAVALGIFYAPTLVPTPSAAADAGLRPISTSDPLTKSLTDAREALNRVPAYLEKREWEKVRQVVDDLLTTMTFSRYTGESVKARASKWAAAGDKELSDKILARRISLTRSIATFEEAVFAAQVSDKKKMLSPDELQAAGRAVTAELDSLLPLLGCESRWKSGRCEILPLAEERTMTDLVGGPKF